MGYFTDNLTLSQANTIIKEREEIDKMIANKEFDKLNHFEEQLFNLWSNWRLRVDVVSTQEQPNTEEQLLEAQQELTVINEILLHSREVNPNSILKVKI
jgi:hypothetical protein